MDFENTIVLFGKEYIISEYLEKMGPIDVPENYLLSKLKDKSLEEQLSLYRISEEAINYKTYAGGDISNYQNRELSGIVASETDNTKGIIVKDGIIVGLIYSGYFGVDTLLAGSSICLYYACDNDGAGYDEYEERAYLNI